MLIPPIAITDPRSSIEIEKREDFTSRLPDEMIFEIFSFLGLEGLVKCTLVSRKWNQISRKAIAKIKVDSLVPSRAFGKEKWEDFLGKVGKVRSLPRNIHLMLASPCPFWEGKKVEETHVLILIPSMVAERSLTPNWLNRLTERSKNSKNLLPDLLFPAEYKKQFGDTPIEKSYWVLMTRDPLPKDKEGNTVGVTQEYETFKIQQEGYFFPRPIEAVICKIMERRLNGRSLLNGKYPPDQGFTPCEPEGFKEPIFVDMSNRSGVEIIGLSELRRREEEIGVAVLRRLPNSSDSPGGSLIGASEVPALPTNPLQKERQKRCVIQ